MNNKQIAKAIRAQWAQDYDLLPITDDGIVTFCVDGLTVRCRANSTDVERVARRYEKGIPYQGRTAPAQGKHSTSRAFSPRAFNDFVTDREFHNAINYARQYLPEDLPAVVLATLNRLEREL